MIPAPLVTLIRYAVVYACGRLAARGWTFFALDADTTDAVVQGVAMLLAVAMTSIGMWTSTVVRVLARLKAHHASALVAAAAEAKAMPVTAPGAQ